jgi:preprotein translocase subunit SecA
MTTHKLNFRLPMDLFEAAQTEAEALHISVNSYVLQALASHVAFTSQNRHKRQAKQLQARAPSHVEATRRPVPKVGRNQPCPCGSGKPYKHCHGNA